MKLYLGLRRTEEDLITHEKSKEQNEIPRRRDDLPSISTGEEEIRREIVVDLSPPRSIVAEEELDTRVSFSFSRSRRRGDAGVAVRERERSLRGLGFLF